MEEKPFNIESFERNVRRHEVSFSQIEKQTGQDIENVIANHGHYSVSAEDEWQKKINTKVLYRNIYKLPQEDREILLDYMTGVKQKDIAEKLGVSPAAINGRLDTIFLNYRTFLCNDKEFKDTEEFYNLQLETEEGFKQYIEEIRKTGQFKVSLNDVQDLIKEIKKAISRTIKTCANKNIKEQLSKQMDYSNLDDNWIKNTNKAFAEYGIEAHFEKLKTFKGNVMQVLKMVDDFIEKLKEKALK